MKRTLVLLLTIGLFLPVLLDGCKKPQDDPVTPGGPTGPQRSDTPGFFHLNLQTQDASQNVGVLMVDVRYQQVSRKYTVRGQYVQFSTRDFTRINTMLGQIRTMVSRGDEGIYAFSTLSNLTQNQLAKLPGYVRTLEVKPLDLIQLMKGQAVLLTHVRLLHEPADPWYARLADVLQSFIATPAYAQTVSQVVGAKASEYRDIYGAEPSQAQLTQWEQNARAQGLPETDFRSGFPLARPETGTTTGTNTSPSTGPGILTVPAGTGLPSAPSVSALGDFLNGISDIVSDIAGLFGNLGNGSTDGLQSAVDGIKVKFDALFSGASTTFTLPSSAPAAGGTRADPIIAGLDGAVKFLHPAGEFWAIRSKNDDFAAQIRFEPVGALAQARASTTTSLAIRTGKDVVSITVKPLAIHLNGQPIKVDFTETQLLQDRAFMTRPATNRYEITTTWGDLIEVRVNPTFNIYWYVRSLSEKRRNQVEGMLGQFNGNAADDFQDKSGKVYTGATPLKSWYDNFANDWRVTQSESILVYPAGKTTESFTFRDFPQKPVSLFDFDLVARDKAEQACRRAGIAQEPDLSDCMTDVLLTGLDEMADQQALGFKLKLDKSVQFSRLNSPSVKAGDGAVGLTVGDKIWAGLGRTSVDWAMYDPATDSWTSKTPFPAGKSSYGRIGTFAIGTKIYCVGGLIDGTTTNALWEYDTQTDKWTRRKDLPGVARFNIAAFASGGKGYALFGATGWGLGEADYPTKGTLFEYDPTADNWTPKADFPAKPRGNNITSSEFNGLAMVINGRPFVGGGSGSGTVWSDWFEYIPVRNVWEKRANCFGGRYYCAIGTVFYAINDRYLMTYDVTTDAWSKWPGKEIFMPVSVNTSRGLYQAPVLNGKAYLGLGGSQDWWSFTP